MRYFLPTLASMVLVGSSAAGDVVVFTDGSRMEVQSYEVKRTVVVLITDRGELFSVPASRVHLEATERVNHGTTQLATGSPSDRALVDPARTPSSPDATEPEAHLEPLLDPVTGSSKTPRNIAPATTMAPPSVNTPPVTRAPLVPRIRNCL